jgi:polyhydroxybutyrate depolymerase
MNPNLPVADRARAHTKRTRWMRRGVAACSALLVTGAMAPASASAAHAPPGSPGCRQPSAPGMTTESLPVGAMTRTYRLVVPPGRGPFGLILNFHGLGSNAVQQAVYSELEQKGPQHGFVVATPEGTQPIGFWNIVPQTLASPDDVAFASTLIDHLEATRCIDPTRVDSTGISNGAGMSGLLACRIPGRLAAIAPVSGLNLVAPCPKGLPVAVLAFHGTGDPIVPYSGGGLGSGLSGLGAALGIHVYPEPDAVAAWAARDRCARTPAHHTVSPEVERTTYTGCTAGTQVVFYSIIGGGHTWPGSTIAVPTLGPTTHDINAADLILAFFSHHHRPGAR